MRKAKTILRSLALLATLSGAANLASAAPILWVSDSSGNLGTVDVTTGNVTVIGGMGQVMTDIAFDPNGNLFGVTFSGLYNINKNTGSISLIGSTGTSLNSLVFDSSGTLYGANSGLYTLDTTNGSTSFVGSGGGYSSSGDLAFIGNDLFLSSGGGDRLFDIDTTTGIGTNIGNIGFSSVYGLATDNNLDLYGVVGTSIINIDTLSGAGSFLINYGGQGLGVAYGSAFFEEACSGNCTSVPEPGSLSLGLLALGLLGVVRLRKQARI